MIIKAVLPRIAVLNAEPAGCDYSAPQWCDITPVSTFKHQYSHSVSTASFIREHGAPATLFTISWLATETDVRPWTVVHQRFPFVGWARFQHSGGHR